MRLVIGVRPSCEGVIAVLSTSPTLAATAFLQNTNRVLDIKQLQVQADLKSSTTDGHNMENSLKILQILKKLVYSLQVCNLGQS